MGAGQLAPTALADMDMEDVSALSIEGSIDVAPEFQKYLSRSDRLIIKLIHPKDGIEMDAKYSIVRTFKLPLNFRISPYILMDGSTRHDKYTVEVFTIKIKTYYVLRAEKYLVPLLIPSNWGAEM